MVTPNNEVTFYGQVCRFCDEKIFSAPHECRYNALHWNILRLKKEIEELNRKHIVDAAKECFAAMAEAQSEVRWEMVAKSLYGALKIAIKKLEGKDKIMTATSVGLRWAAANYTTAKMFPRKDK